jgi:hypothetical protein
MRWMFLWLVVLNLFYYVWHQQQAPLRVTEIAPLNMAQDSKRDIRLLSESSAPARREVVVSQPVEAVCLFLGSFEVMADASAVEQRLLSLDIQSRVQSMDAVSTAARIKAGFTAPAA